MAITLGLERIQKLLNAIGNPQKSFTKIIHVAGTNGKGSVCAFLTDFISESFPDHKIGTFYSPHVKHPSDAIKINNNSCSLDFYLERRKIVENANQFGATLFEIQTATAFLVFKDWKIDVAIVEVGIGGRLDATNVLEGKSLSIITSIGLDHVEFLGNTIVSIAREKAGIFSNTEKVLIGYQKEPNALKTLKEEAEKYKIENNEMYSINEISCVGGQSVKSDSDILHWRLENNTEYNVACTFLSPICLMNASTALTAFKILYPENELPNVLSLNHFGRYCSTKVNGKEVFVDGAHNRDGLKELSDYIRNTHTSKKIHWIVGFKKGKDYKELLGQFLRVEDKITFVPFDKVIDMPWIACADVHELSNLSFQLYPGISASSAQSINDAIASLNDKEEMIIITGSLYLLSEIEELIY
ncbi:Mur ligase, central domain-containing protein [Rozella allomycis CSF55]|uniref:Dihydrofolate synthetase n=1 Tax=Rozella allomycis (strain CSF55) TaxID=988480 RepID=A0A075AVS3_ROZAC|nr:Mur ligase, central domain-containing protein [Rozella allomycis CSF55]|eukprot:EPZ34370.1 Mur ligase, central domain-containing protein [Rozella allomycis CSF55]